MFNGFNTQAQMMNTDPLASAYFHPEMTASLFSNVTPSTLSSTSSSSNNSNSNRVTPNGILNQQSMFGSIGNCGIIGQANGPSIGSADSNRINGSFSTPPQHQYFGSAVNRGSGVTKMGSAANKLHPIAKQNLNNSFNNVAGISGGPTLSYGKFFASNMQTTNVPGSDISSSPMSFNTNKSSPMLVNPNKTPSNGSKLVNGTCGSLESNSSFSYSHVTDHNHHNGDIGNSFGKSWFGDLHKSEASSLLPNQQNLFDNQWDRLVSTDMNGGVSQHVPPLSNNKLDNGLMRDLWPSTNSGNSADLLEAGSNDFGGTSVQTSAPSSNLFGSRSLWSSNGVGMSSEPPTSVTPASTVIKESLWENADNFNIKNINQPDFGTPNGLFQSYGALNLIDDTLFGDSKFKSDSVVHQLVDSVNKFVEKASLFNKLKFILIHLCADRFFILTFNLLKTTLNFAPPWPTFPVGKTAKWGLLITNWNRSL